MKLFKKLKTKVTNSGSIISIAIGAGILVHSGLKYAKATVKAKELIDIREQQLECHPLPTKESLKILGKCYAMPVVETVVGATCIAVPHMSTVKKNIALAGVASAAQSALKTHLDTTAEVLGESAANAVRDAVTQKKIDEQPAPEPEKKVVVAGGIKTVMPFWESITQSYIYTTKKDIDDAVDQMVIAQKYSSHGALDANTWLSEIGAKELPWFIDIGWNLEKDRDFFKIRYGLHTDPDGNDCYSIEYPVPPYHGYDY